MTYEALRDMILAKGYVVEEDGVIYCFWCDASTQTLFPPLEAIAHTPECLYAQLQREAVVHEDARA